MKSSSATQASPTPHIPPYHQFMWPALRAIQELGGSGRIQEINAHAAAIAGLSDEQLNVLHVNGPMTEFEYRMHWARTYLGTVGAIVNSSRGVWSITGEGKSVSEADIPDIVAKVRAMHAKKRAERARLDADASSNGNPDEEDTTTSDESGFTDDDKLDWRDRLLSVVQNLPPSAFERLSQRVLRESGFTSVEVTGKSGDGGIDGVGVLRVALLSFQVFFQCKRYKGSVGAPAIRDLRGAMWGRTDKGLLITTGIFTPDAKREATRDGAPVIDLIDGNELCTLLKELKLGVSTKLVEETTIDSEWFQSI